jgi:hypothetical protein
MPRYSIAAVCLLASSASAFAPSRRHGQGRSSFVGSKPAAFIAKPSSSSALQMNLFDRFARVAKANLNNVLQNLEDPEKIMTQAVEDMQVRFSSLMLVLVPVVFVFVFVFVAYSTFVPHSLTNNSLTVPTPTDRLGQD